MLKKANKYSVYLSFCILPVLLLVFIWFRQRFMLAGAEEGLPFYNSLRTFNLYKSVWLEAGLGNATSFFLPRLVLYGFASLLQMIGISSWGIEAVIFFILLITPLLSVPVLVKEVISKDKGTVGIISSFFYLFNLFTMSQVWGRFIYPLMFLWSYLPLFLLLWIKFVKSGKVKFLLFLIITSFLYSDAFGLTSSIFAIWVSAVIFSLIYFWREKNWKILLFSLLGILLWGLLNTWWLYPTWALRNNTFSPMLDSEKTTLALEEVSRFYPNGELLLLRQKYLFGPKSVWFSFYQQANTYTISWFILFAVFAGVIFLRKNKNWTFLSALLLVGWFISKGANPPFGSVFFKFIYSVLPVTQVLRNPYEKFGVVFLLAYSIFFSFGVSEVIRILKINKFLTISLVLASCAYLVSPIWNGQVFKNYSVTVPPYYEEADRFLSNNGGRILHLPFLRGAVVAFKWGYLGEEPSEFLFEKKSISKLSGLPELDEAYLELPNFFNNPNFPNILRLFGIDTIILHSDIIKSTYHQEWVNDTKEMIKKWNGIAFEKKIGELEIYRIENSPPGEVYLSQNLKEVSDVGSGFKIITSQVFDPYKLSFLADSQNSTKFEITSINKLPEYGVRKSSPGKYSVHIENAQGPFVLILPQAYNSLWDARILGIKIEKHFKINGFANGWIIDKQGSYNIDINFNIFLPN